MHAPDRSISSASPSPLSRRSFVTIALAAGATVALAGCGSTSNSNSSSDSSSDGLTTPGTFAVGFDQDFPPYGYVGDDGSFTGFDLELAVEVCNRRGWTIKYVPIDWDAKDMELDSGAIDCIWNGFTINGREDDYTWTEPYMDNSQVVVVKSTSGIESLADLKGKIVMTQADSAALTLLQGDQADLAATFSSLETIPEYDTAFMELEQGSVDAVAIDLPVANYEISESPDAYTILSEHLSEEQYGVGFKLGNTTLRDEVQTTLVEMSEDGFVKSLCEKYADQGISYEQFLLGK